MMSLGFTLSLSKGGKSELHLALYWADKKVAGNARRPASGGAEMRTVTIPPLSGGVKRLNSYPGARAKQKSVFRHRISVKSSSHDPCGNIGAR